MKCESACEHTNTHARTHTTLTLNQKKTKTLRVSQLPKQVQSILISAIFTHAHCPRKYPHQAAGPSFHCLRQVQTDWRQTRAAPEKTLWQLSKSRIASRRGAACTARREWGRVEGTKMRRVRAHRHLLSVHMIRNAARPS